MQSQTTHNHVCKSQTLENSSVQHICCDWCELCDQIRVWLSKRIWTIQSTIRCFEQQMWSSSQHVHNLARRSRPEKISIPIRCYKSNISQRSVPNYAKIYRVKLEAWLKTITSSSNGNPILLLLCNDMNGSLGLRQLVSVAHTAWASSVIKFVLCLTANDRSTYCPT